MQKLIQNSFSTLERIYLVNKSKQKTNLYINQHRQKFTLDLPSNDVSKSQQVTANTIPHRFTQHQNNDVPHREILKSFKKIRPKSTLDHNIKSNSFNRYERQIINGLNTEPVFQNMQQLRKIIGILKSENNGIVFGRKRDIKNKTCIQKLSTDKCELKRQQKRCKQAPDPNRFHPRFKHYNYSFSKKKYDHVTDPDIKKDIFNRVTKDTSLQMIDTVQRLYDQDKILGSFCKKWEGKDKKGQGKNKNYLTKKHQDKMDNVYFIKTLPHS